MVRPTVPSQDVPMSDSAIRAAFAAGRTQPTSTPWEPPTPEELQQDFPQYEIRGILGRGGMGAVYKGWQRSLDRLVAIKILPPGLDDGVSDFSERFKREAKAMAHLKHPGIVAVHDAGTTPSGLLYFVMECVEGTDVQKLMNDRKQLAPAEALRITSEVCDALAYAHAHDVIHRDIKPSNIMLDEHGAVKVADFGLAKSTAPETTVLTVSHVTMGTPDFMAPEALHGVANVDHRADIYAVGVMLYQTLTGKLPRGKYDPPSRVVPGLDKRLDRIVDRALQPDPTARYSSATEMRTAIGPVTQSISKHRDHFRDILLFCPVEGGRQRKGSGEAGDKAARQGAQPRLAARGDKRETLCEHARPGVRARAGDERAFLQMGDAGEGLRGICQGEQGG
jgi:serine/threonine protein kinase